MKDLITGANAPLATSGEIRIALGWRAAPSELDVVCFALGANGKVPSDQWFLFFNQPEAPEQTIRFSATELNKAEFLVDLDRLPAHIDKCVFAGVLEGEGSFADVQEAGIAAIARDGSRLCYQITEPFPGKALIFAEVYRHAARGWKMRAVGQGFSGGLKPLAEHYGVEVADESHLPSPSPLPAPSPAAPTPPLPRREPEEAAPDPSRQSVFLRLVKLCMVLILLAACAGLAAYFYTPTRPYVAAYIGDFKNRLLPPATVIKPDQGELTAAPTISRSANYVEPQCELVAGEVFERYHSLGENYLKIRAIVDDSDLQRERIKRIMRAPEFDCSDKFNELNQREIERLGKLPLAGWIQETNRLNICAGLLNKRVEDHLSNETRPTIIQRLVQEADRTRNLESDLTNIARDLAYFNNKVERLLGAYNTNLEVCSL